MKQEPGRASCHLITPFRDATCQSSKTVMITPSPKKRCQEVDTETRRDDRELKLAADKPLHFGLQAVHFLRQRIGKLQAPCPIHAIR